MPITKLRQLLDHEGVRYVSIRHSPAYTADAIAASAHIPTDQMAKTVMLHIDGRLAMAVLPATEQLDLDTVREYLQASRVTLAPEREFRVWFPDCEIGAMPPFGNLYGLNLYATESLTEQERIAFNAGTHGECIEMDLWDYLRLARPTILHATALRT